MVKRHVFGGVRQGELRRASRSEPRAVSSRQYKHAGSEV